MTQLIELQNKFSILVDQLVELNYDDNKLEAMLNKFDNAVNTINTVYLKTTDQSRLSTEVKDPPLPLAPPSRPHIRLPTIQLPKFSGKIEEWLNFYNLFKTSIHEREELTDNEKLMYLKSHLVGEPLTLVKNIAPGPQNYQVAWEILLDRYQNDRRHINHHFNGLIDLPDLGSNNLSSFVSQLLEHIHALDAINYHQSSYEALLNVWLLRKFNNYHRKRLDDSRDDKKVMPTLNEIISYLKSELSHLLESDYKTPSTAPKTPKIAPSPPVRLQAFQASEQSEPRKWPNPTRSETAPSQNNSNKTTFNGQKCILCPNSDSHNTGNCEKYRSKSL